MLTAHDNNPGSPAPAPRSGHGAASVIPHLYDVSTGSLPPLPREVTACEGPGDSVPSESVSGDSDGG
jgi:hypothetical protein